ncbi:MAG: aminopeptidase N [Nanoarchaeota archaeon]|nr:aminopeptidase N [Nanoarchaeota archaeon]
MQHKYTKRTYEKDYRKPDFKIPAIHLDFNIHEQYTIVKSRLKIIAEINDNETNKPLILDGINLNLRSLKINGVELDKKEYTLTKENLTISNPPKEFTLEAETEIEPHKNKALMGLYRSNGIFCTQNEAEGFRCITFFLDRPDVMSIYTTRIEANKTELPVLLSNGNPINKGDLPDGRHFVTWEDPFMKPCYLFALVAGDLAFVQDKFMTKSKRDIDLRIYVEKGMEDKCSHALDSLKKAMKWDEDTFGLECDLNTYMIVAINDFNHAAMENKGLNIFGSSYVLADPETASDANFQNITWVIAHEYFHNWTGNRITCRDWFQLTLKEGLTVFRHQEFRADMTSRPVKRISDVCTIKNHQFSEDAGPNAHPIKPAYYMEIDNFYTTTIYQKGAEVIRMIHTFLGKEKFRKGIDKYFELYDGQAVTTEDFIHAMELASGMDFTHFKRWYSQAGTPVCSVTGEYNAEAKTYTLNIKQSCPATPESREKKPFHFPLSIGLLDSDGKDMKLQLAGEQENSETTKILHIKKQEETFIFENVSEKPLPSLLRNFSAPVKLEFDYAKDDLIFLLANDSNEFNRYEAGQKLAMIEFKKIIAEIQAGNEPVLDDTVLDAFGRILSDSNLDNEFISEAMHLPTLAILVEDMNICDYDSAYKAKKAFIKSLAQRHEDLFKQLYKQLSSHEGAYSIDSASIGRRSLKHLALYYLASLKTDEYIKLAFDQFNNATNMTETISALCALADIDCPEKEEALKAFYNKWKHNSSVMDKWFAIQASSDIDNLLETVKSLEKDPAFDRQNPYKLSALFGSYARNVVRFHDISGKGYTYLADKILEIDKFNSKASARFCTAFNKYPKMDKARKALMGNELMRILETEGISKGVYEILSNIKKSH